MAKKSNKQQKQELKSTDKKHVSGKIHKKEQSDKNSSMHTHSEENAAITQKKIRTHKFKWTNKRILTIIPFVFAVVLYLLVWKEPEVKVNDPWYDAVYLIDSAREVKDPIQKKKLFEEGGSKLKELAKKHPYHARVRFFLGYYYYFTDQWDSAIDELKEAIRIDSGATINPVWIDSKLLIVNCLVNKSVVAVNNNDLRSAVKSLILALKYKPDNADIWNNCGVIYSRMQNLPRAVEFFKKAIEVDPNHPKARQNLISALVQLGDTATARLYVNQ